MKRKLLLELLAALPGWVQPGGGIRQPCAGAALRDLQSARQPGFTIHCYRVLLALRRGAEAHRQPDLAINQNPRVPELFLLRLQARIGRNTLAAPNDPALPAYRRLCPASPGSSPAPASRLPHAAFVFSA